jgi:transcriptional regulator with XRE-family HTH domain
MYAVSKDRQVVPPNRLAELRRARGLSREGLAYFAGLNVRTVERLETGVHPPRRATKVVLAAALGVQPSELGFPAIEGDPDLLPAA